METDSDWLKKLCVLIQIEPLGLKLASLDVLNSYRAALLESQQDCKRLKEERDKILGENCNLEIKNVHLNEQIAKLKTEFDIIQCHNASLQEQAENQDRRRINVAPYPTPAVTPRKRQRIQEDDLYSPDVRRMVKPKHPSRERIKYVLGGSDRGWGSMVSRNVLGQFDYTHHVLLDVVHLLDHVPFLGKDLQEVMFGLSDTDEIVTHERVTFPLFVRRESGNGKPFSYLGNYVAIRLDPLDWESLSLNEQQSAVDMCVGAECRYRHDDEKKKSALTSYFRAQFVGGALRVPRCRLEHQNFDSALLKEIRHAPGRTNSKTKHFDDLSY